MIVNPPLKQADSSDGIMAAVDDQGGFWLRQSIRGKPKNGTLTVLQWYNTELKQRSGNTVIIHHSGTGYFFYIKSSSFWSDMKF